MALRRLPPPPVPSRRSVLRGLGLGALTLPFARLFAGGEARGDGGPARRVLFFYFPDGVVAESQDGEASKWHPSGSGSSFTLGEQLTPLEPWRDRCVFFRGLSMGPTDSGSHPGGAKKLLTAADYGNNESIDQYLSRTVGASSPWRHLYLGVQATVNNASGDKFITYPIAGQSMAPEDDPARAFASLFGSSPGGGGSSGGTDTGAADRSAARTRSLLDAATADILSLQGRLGSAEREKLDLHLTSLRELEQRLSGGGTGTGGTGSASCDDPGLGGGPWDGAALADPAQFPAQLEAQLDLAVLAMECGLTRVATIQCSMHTSELIMSRFPGTPFSDAGYDMRSHQASHYGARHDPSKREYRDFLAQRQWWAARFAGLLDRLASRPEGDGTMLDHSIVVLVTEVNDGNTHLHDNMPFVLAGGASGRIRGGRVLDAGGARHGDLWTAVGQAMGAELSRFGDASSGPLNGLLG